MFAISLQCASCGHIETLTEFEVYGTDYGLEFHDKGGFDDWFFISSRNPHACFLVCPRCGKTIDIKSNIEEYLNRDPD